VQRVLRCCHSMGTRERPADRGRRRTRDALRRLASDYRQARVGAGLSLRDAAAAAGASHSQLLRFERGEIERLTLAEVGAWCAVVGLDLGLRAYPAGDPIRDRAQLALLERFRARLHPSIDPRRSEVPLPLDGDLRAWDGEAAGRGPAPWRMRVEAETRLSDGQALTRRFQLKIRDDPHGHVALLVSDTRANRRALSAIRDGLLDLLPLETRQILGALSAGEDPGRSGVVIL
jgi:transcriptional regulator with XRE-family HTH domain